MIGSDEDAKDFWENVWRNCHIVRDGKPVKLITKDMVENCNNYGAITHEHLQRVAEYLGYSLDREKQKDS